MYSCLASFTQQDASKVQPCVCIGSLLLFTGDDYSMVQLYLSLCIHSPPDGHLCCFHLGPLWIKVLWTFTYKSFGGHVSLFLLSKHLEVERAARIISVYLTFKKVPNWFHKWLSKFALPTAGHENLITSHHILGLWRGSLPPTLMRIPPKPVWFRGDAQPMALLHKASPCPLPTAPHLGSLNSLHWSAGLGQTLGSSLAQPRTTLPIWLLTPRGLSQI